MIFSSACSNEISTPLDFGSTSGSPVGERGDAAMGRGMREGESRIDLAGGGGAESRVAVEQDRLVAGLTRRDSGSILNAAGDTGDSGV